LLLLVVEVVEVKELVLAVVVDLGLMFQDIH
jgi:hypothetical protein